MISVDAQHGDAELVQPLFSVPVTAFIAVIVHAYITQEDDGVLFGDLVFFDRFCYTE